ncbi:MAG: hypothetical protein IJ448_01355 [Oscillospiraceae bacterium]|nr:hypothetical protein [Oscillospiraceae bacterium]
MVINEKALVRQMKEAYKTYGYTVAVVGERMMLTNGFWLASIDVDNVPAGLLGMLAEHIRDVPKEGQAYKVIKDKDGAFVQHRIMEEAIEPLARMFKEKEAAGYMKQMRRTNLTLTGMQLWQAPESSVMYMIDPRYAALFDDHNEVVRLGGGIYAEGEISELWVLRFADGELADKISHLEQVQWVK